MASSSFEGNTQTKFANLMTRMDRAERYMNVHARSPVRSGQRARRTGRRVRPSTPESEGSSLERAGPSRLSEEVVYRPHVREAEGLVGAGTEADPFRLVPILDVSDGVVRETVVAEGSGDPFVTATELSDSESA